MANTSLQDLQKIISTNTAALKKSNKKLGNVYQSYANGLVNNGAIQAIENARQNMQNTTNRQYDDSARNYYAQYRRNEANLPARLSALGITGGASETAQLGLMSNYSGNLYNNESARANALNTGNMQYDQMIADNSKALANQLAETYLNLALQAQASGGGSGGGGGGGSSRRYGGGYYSGGGSNLSLNVGSDSGSAKGSAGTAINSVLAGAQKVKDVAKKGKKGNSNAVSKQARAYINVLTNPNISSAKRSNTANALSKLLSTKGGSLSPSEYSSLWSQYLKYRKAGVNTKSKASSKGGGLKTNALQRR